MVRRVLLLVLAMQLLLPSHAVQSWLASAFAAATAVEAKPISVGKVCPCTGNPTCKCCGGADEPEDESAPVKPDAPPGPHGTFKCGCKVVESLLMPIVYLADRGLSFQTLAHPQQEQLLLTSAPWLSTSLSIDSPPPKN